jgi:glycosyltransferase involved in cell wall biosynthesis
MGLKIKPNIIHCHDTFALLSGYILKMALGCQLIYDAHELESDKNMQSKLLSIATLFIEKFCWNKINLLISVSDAILEWYDKNLGHKPGLLVLNSPIINGAIGLGIDSIAHEHYFHHKYKIPPGSLVFIYLGMLSRGRGIEIILDAFASGPEDAHVVFMGDGILDSLICKYASLNTNIHLHPAVAHDKVVPLVSQADYGLCIIENTSLSDYYCLPNKLFEYCFSGLPVLASNFPEMKKIVDEYSLGFCCPPNSIDVTHAIANFVLARPPKLSVDLDELSWDAQARHLKNAYLKIIASND